MIMVLLILVPWVGLLPQCLPLAVMPSSAMSSRKGLFVVHLKIRGVSLPLQRWEKKKRKGWGEEDNSFCFSLT